MPYPEGVHLQGLVNLSHPNTFNLKRWGDKWRCVSTFTYTRAGHGTGTQQT